METHEKSPPTRADTANIIGESYIMSLSTRHDPPHISHQQTSS